MTHDTDGEFLNRIRQDSSPNQETFQSYVQLTGQSQR